MDDDIYIPLSYISQYNYCARRAGLLLLREQWNENEYTASGRAEHENVHDCRVEKHGSTLLLYETTLYSAVFKLSGKSDCIEATPSDDGAVLPFTGGRWSLFPIEYKHGIQRSEYEYNLQLTAQAMCLEEMLSCSVTAGAIFYISSHRRIDVAITDDMRRDVKVTAKALHNMCLNGKISNPEWSAKCKKCSMLNCCHPKLKRSAGIYMKDFYNESGECEL